MSGARESRPRISGERRIFSLVLALVASPQGRLKQELLASVYGYSDRYRAGTHDPALERQFERDKEQLRQLGIPIETLDSPEESGNNRLTRYRISKERLQMPADVRFTARELAVLRLAALAWRDGSLTAESRRSAMKLEALGAGLDVQHLGIAPTLGTPEPAASPLHHAIEGGFVVRFAYQLPERDAPLERRVAPLRLHRADGRWHLIGHDLDRQADRVFLLSRIIGPVTVTSATFDPALRPRAASMVEMLHERHAAQQATVVARAGTVAEARLAGRASITAAHDSGTRLTLGTLDEHEFAVELAGYGDEVAVEAPLSLGARVADLLVEIRDAHAGAPEVWSGPTPEQPPASGRGRAALATPERVVLLLSLVPYLREHGEATIDELARVFDVKAATLRELIEFLGTAGIPGETQTYQDEDLFDIDWDALESGIVRLTRVVAVDDTPRFSAVEGAALLAGLHSLMPVLPADERAYAERAAEKLRRASDPNARGDGAPLSLTATPEDHRIAILVDALERGRRLRFLYRDLQGNETLRTVEPISVQQTTGAWYLRAYCLDRDAERTFLLDGMREIAVVEGHDGASAMDRRARGTVVAATSLGPEEALIPALVRVRESALHRFASFAPAILGPAGPGWVMASVNLVHYAAAVRAVQAAPGDVVVDAPAEAREAVLAWADRALAQYAR